MYHQYTENTKPFYKHFLFYLGHVVDISGTLCKKETNKKERMLTNFGQEKKVESSETIRKKLYNLILIEKTDTRENMKGIKKGVAAKENIGMSGEETKAKVGVWFKMYPCI